MTDREAIHIEGIRKNDSAIMEDIFNVYYTPLCLYLLRLINSYEDIEDIVQDVLFSFWENKRGTDFKGSIRSYLFGSVHKAALYFLKRKGLRQHVDISHIDYFREETPIICEDDELAHRKSILEKEIAKLPPKCRDVFLAIVLENLSYKETALKLNISLNTVKTHYSRALKQLRNNLDSVILLLLSGVSR